MRKRDERLGAWMIADLILQHPFVTAEIGMGRFSSAADRARTVDLLDSFEQIEIPDASAFHQFVADQSLYGTGIGIIDAHLLLACTQNRHARLATRNKRLAIQAERLGLVCEPPQ